MQQAPATPPAGTTAASILPPNASNPLTSSQGLQVSSTTTQGMQVPSPPHPGTIQALLDLAAQNQHQQPHYTLTMFPAITSAYSKMPNIMTTQIMPTYTGSITGFFTFLFQLQECHSICHFWALATCLQDINLLTHFATVDLDHALAHIATQWTPEFCKHIYEPGSLACAAQLFYF